MFKLQSPSKYSLMQHLLRLFSTAWNSFWTHWFCLLVLLPFFVFLLQLSQFSPLALPLHPPRSHSQSPLFCPCPWVLCHLFHINKSFPFEDFFHLGGKKFAPGKIRWIGRVKAGSHTIFSQKLLNTQCMWAGALINHPSGHGQMHLKRLQNKFTETKCSLSQHQLVHWYSWVPRTLT